MTDRQLDPEQEVEIAEEWTHRPGEPGHAPQSQDVRRTPAQPVDTDRQDESTEFDRHREAGAAQ